MTPTPEMIALFGAALPLFQQGEAAPTAVPTERTPADMPAARERRQRSGKVPSHIAAATHKVSIKFRNNPNLVHFYPPKSVKDPVSHFLSKLSPGSRWHAAGFEHATIYRATGPGGIGDFSTVAIVERIKAVKTKE